MIPSRVVTLLTVCLRVLQLHVRSPHRNSTFQKLFNLPDEEFLIADYACSLKRKLPLQVNSLQVLGFTVKVGFMNSARSAFY